MRPTEKRQIVDAATLEMRDGVAAASFLYGHQTTTVELGLFRSKQHYSVVFLGGNEARNAGVFEVKFSDMFYVSKLGLSFSGSAPPNLDVSGSSPSWVTILY